MYLEICDCHNADKYTVSYIKDMYNPECPVCALIKENEKLNVIVKKLENDVGNLEDTVFDMEEAAKNILSTSFEELPLLLDTKSDYEKELISYRFKTGR